jgi:TonB family protein
MSAAVMTVEMATISSQTRKMFVVSLVLHAILIAFLCLYRQIQPGPVTLTEITMIEPGEEPAAPPSPPPPALRAPERGLTPKPAPTPEHFVRPLQRAAVEPDPQSRIAEDRLAERLSSLQQSAASRSATAAPLAVGTSPSLAGAPATIGTGAPSGASVGLVREGTSAGPVVPLEMKRSGTSAAAVVPAGLPQTDVRPAAAHKAAEGAAARRTLAGATLLGPVADRKLLSFVQPAYPEWAKKEGVEAIVRLYFVVLEDGSLKESIVIQKTSGYQDFDANAVDALRKWRFEALPRGSAGEQWGEITFRYRLSDGAAG